MIEHGDDLQAAREHAAVLSAELGCTGSSFDSALVGGVASYCLEFFRGAPSLDVAYVPVGLGSGICAMIAARDALGLATEIVGWCRRMRQPMPCPSRRGACCPPHQHSPGGRPGLQHARACGAGDDPGRCESHRAGQRRRGGGRHVRTLRGHPQRGGGCGAASLAAAMQERGNLAGQRVGVVLSGGNDRAAFSRCSVAGWPHEPARRGCSHG